MVLQKKKSKEWEQINFRNVVSLIGAQFVFDLYDQFVPEVNVYRYRNILAYYKDGKLWTYTPKKDLHYIKQNIEMMFDIKGTGICEEIEFYFKREKKALSYLKAKIDSVNLMKSTNTELAYLINEWYYTTLNDIFPMNLAPIEQGITQVIRKILAHLKVENIDALISKLFVLDEKTLAGTEEYDLLLLAKKIKLNKELYSELLQLQYEKYYFLPFAYGSCAWKKDYFSKRLDLLLQLSLSEIDEKIVSVNNDVLSKINHREEILSGFDNQKLELLVHAACNLGLLRDKNKGLLASSIVYRNKIVEQIELKTGEDLTYYFLDEITNLLLNGIVVSSDDIELRKHGVVMKSKLSYSSGELARKENVQIINNCCSEGIFKGTCASGGVAKGKVRICQRAQDCEKLESGEIMVAYGTDFDFIEGMIKAMAIVTEEGGILSHASVISREMNKPCIVGVSNILNQLKDGDYIKIDADVGIIEVISQTIFTTNTTSEFFLAFEELKNVDITKVGHKAYSIYKMQKKGLLIPEGFVISSEYFMNQIKKENLEKEYNVALNVLINTFDSTMMEKLIDNIEIDEHTFDFLDFSNSYAVRSSGPSEDSKSLSFAGQHYTGLYADSSKTLIHEIKKCWKSFVCKGAILYRNKNMIANHDYVGGVIIQEMVVSEYSGIVFSINPVDLVKKELIIETFVGDCRRIVDGIVQPTRYRIKRNKTEIIYVDVSQAFELQSNIISELIDSAMLLEQDFESYVDIEWTYSNGRIYYLQCRPVVL